MALGPVVGQSGQGQRDGRSTARPVPIDRASIARKIARRLAEGEKRENGARFTVCRGVLSDGAAISRAHAHLALTDDSGEALFQSSLCASVYWIEQERGCAGARCLARVSLEAARGCRRAIRRCPRR